MRLFNDSAFLAAARVEISEQINACASDLKELGNAVKDADTSKFDEHQQNLLSEVSAGIHQIKTLFENANQMIANIEHFLLSGEFPSSEDMKKSIEQSKADTTALDLIENYAALNEENKEKFAFVACNYELISVMLENANELCAVLLKAAKRF